MDKKLPEMVLKLWDLSNLITGFAVVQSIAFGYVTLNDNWRTKVENYHVVPVVITFMIIFGVILECLAVNWCSKKSLEATTWSGPPSPEVQRLFQKVNVGRMICIILFGVLSLLAAWGPVIDKKFLRG